MTEQNIVAAVLQKVRAAIGGLITEGALPPGLDLSRISAEPPREAAHGDFATNAAMVLSNQARRKPRELAELIVVKLHSDDLIATAQVAGPGFINLTLKPLGAALVAEFGRDLLSWSEARRLEVVRQKSVAMMMAMIRADLAALNVRHDVFFSERSMLEGGRDLVAETIARLRERGDVYE